MNLLSGYDKFNQANPANAALAAFRQAAFDYASKKGLPTRKDEDWHYTSVKSLTEKDYALSAKTEPSADSLVELKKLLNPAFTNVVFVNGVLNKSLSSDLPAGFTMREPSDYSEVFMDTFEALNAAYTAKPMVLNLAKETSVEKPVNFVFYTDADTAVMTHPRIRLDVSARSSVKVLESYYGKGANYFVNSLFDLHIGDNANVTYVRVQSEAETAINIGRTRITVGKDANLQSLALATGAGLSRHSLEVLLKEKGSNSDILGIYAVKGTQHVDNTTVIDHQVGECNTNQLYKGILDDSSRAAFSGKVLIQKDAQKANSAQLNNNLLLSSKAEADSRPSLEIFADDVKAAHGSTTGQLNREELFYLLSRAIPKDKAIQMLSYGFLSEVVYKISDDSIQHWLTRHLDEAFTRLHLETK
ncbi:Fe-S cluster assembly protein SufD [Bdellovibrio sp. NC01]|uniref:Fe-S cluster assembly protein SufD n=1 Tax=Bdellovibrio sp. NC01 TaxID=2220073 RepID=UPI00115AA999|nr:Fe-S cluster assembly protein SufD [Bdellovibrio sp. NC01]QDK36240.1 Fe-S cluster assembly protein SufD [Bdellovibrio sp. NC01]